LLTVFALSGCGGPTIVQIDGRATRNGDPVANLFVNFMPEKGRPSWGITDQAGKFVLHYDAQRDGVLVGKHKISVSFRPRSPQEEADMASGKIELHPERQAIVEKYGNPTSSPLTAEIAAEGQAVHLQLD